MRGVESFSEVYLYTGVLDMRLGMDRIAEKIRDELNCSPLSGAVFAFVSRCRRRVKLVYWDRDGYALWLKRLEEGAFRIEKREGYETITGVDLKELLSGLELSRIKLRRDAERGLYG